MNIYRRFEVSHSLHFNSQIEKTTDPEDEFWLRESEYEVNTNLWNICDYRHCLTPQKTQTLVIIRFACKFCCVSEK